MIRLEKNSTKNLLIIFIILLSSSCNQPHPATMKRELLSQNSNFKIIISNGGGWQDVVYITDRYEWYDSYIEFTDKMTNKTIILSGCFIIEKLK